jgi:hypothetical protein
MGWRHAAVGLVGSFWAVVGCGTSDSAPHDEEPPKMCQPGETQLIACECEDHSYGKVEFDVCTDKPVGSAACMCPEPVACEVEGTACPASQRCYGDDDCDKCECIQPTVTETLRLQDGVVADLTSDGRGNAVLLMAAEPWLFRVTPERALAPIPVQSALDWAKFAWGAPNGSIVVLGWDGQMPAKVRFQRFGTDGSLLGEGTWSISETQGTSLLRIAPHPDGRLALLGWSGDTIVALGVLDVGNDVVETLSVTDFNDDPLGTGKCCGRRPNSFAVGLDGDFYVAGRMDGYQRIDASWRVRFDARGAPTGEVLDEAFDFFDTEPLLVGSAAGLFHVWSWFFSDDKPLDAYFAKLSPALAAEWQVVSKGEGYKDDRVTALAALPDGFVAGGTHLGAPVLWRFNRDGAAFALPVTLQTPPERIVPVGDYQLAILEPTEKSSLVEVHPLTFVKLPPPNE